MQNVRIYKIIAIRSLPPNPLAVLDGVVLKKIPLAATAM